MFKQNASISMLLLLVVVGLSACAGSNVVPLSYPSTLEDSPWCRWPCTVVKFQDLREEKALGTMDEENQYVTKSSVAEWASRGIYQEMEARGCEVRYVDTMTKAGHGFSVTGEVLEVGLDKIGFNKWETSLKVKVELLNNGESVFAEYYTGSVERTFFMAKDAPRDILAEALQDVMKNAVLKIIDAMTAEHFGGE